MPLYKCKLRDSEGKLIEADFSAYDELHLRKKVDNLGFYLLSYKKKRTWRKKNRNEEIVFFLEQLKILLRAGVLIDEAINIIIENSDFSPSFRKALWDVKVMLEQGESFSTALSKYPRFFSPFMVSLIQTGEKSGELPEILVHLTGFYEEKQRFEKKVFSLFFYPTFLLVFMVGVLFFISSVILPKYQAVFKGMNLKLPLITNMVFSFSMFLKTYLAVILIVIAVLIGGVIYIFKFHRSLMLKVLSSFPVVGTLIQDYYQLRVYLSLSLLLKGKVQLNEALKLVADGMEFRYLREQLQYIYRELLKGNSFSSLVEISTYIFPPFLQGIIKTGEKTGNLEEVFTQLYQYSLDNLERKFAFTVQLLEPLIIIFLGVSVGFLVLSLFLPLISFINQV